MTEQFTLDGKRYRSLIACEAVLDALSREVLATLPLMEPLARREFGNTNYATLIRAAERAREVLKQSDAAFTVDAGAAMFEASVQSLNPKQ